MAPNNIRHRDATCHRCGATVLVEEVQVVLDSGPLPWQVTDVRCPTDGNVTADFQQPKEP